MNQVRYTFCLLSFLLLSLTRSFSQEKNIYISDYKQKLIVTGFTMKEFLDISLSDQEQNLIYKPNNPLEFGLGFSYKNTFLSFAYGYGFDFMRDKKRGKTESLDLQYHHYSRKYMFDLFMQRYSGFYMEEKDSRDYMLTPDLKLRQYGLHGQYVFNHNRFSYKAAFMHNEKQLRSAGSFLLGGGIYYSQIRSDSSFVYNHLNHFQLGVSIGYVHTWVFNKHWFVSGAITSGINVGTEKFGRLKSLQLKVSPTVFPRLSIGYDHDSWSLGFIYLSNITFPVFSEDIKIGLLSGRFQLSYYRRIKDVPFLSRLTQ